jgi:hypothetical protein
MRKDEIETAEIADAELDNVSGGVLGGLPVVGGLVSSAGGLLPDVAADVNGVGVSVSDGHVNAGGVDLGGLSGALGGL